MEPKVFTRVAKDDFANLLDQSGEMTPVISPDEDKRTKLIKIQNQLIISLTERIRELEKELENAKSSRVTEGVRQFVEAPLE